MPSQWLTLDGFGTLGMQPDQMSTHRELGALDMALNCRPVGRDLRLAGGYTAELDIPAKSLTLFTQQAWGDMLLYSCAKSGVRQYRADGGWADITDEAFSLQPVEENQPCGRWSGGFIQATMVFNNCGIVRTYTYDAENPTTTLMRPLRYDRSFNDLTWEDFGLSGAVMRMWKAYGFAANITNESTKQYWPQRIMWSHPCSIPEDDVDNPGETTLNSAPPERWFPGDATSLAGDIDLTDTPGIIVDMVPLRDQLIIYKSDAIYTCTETFDSNVFRFRHVLSNRGVPGRDCVQEYNGIHYVQGVEDLFVFDGNSAKTLAWGKVKRFWLQDRDPDKAGNSFTSINPKHEEVLFHYTPRDSSLDWPSKALAFCIATGAWTLRDYSTSIQHSVWSRTVWSIASADWKLYAIAGEDQVVDLETGTTQDGGGIPVEISRSGLVANPGHDWVQVDAVKVGMIADNGQTFELRLGGQVAPSAPTTWRAQFVVDPATDYKTDARMNDNIVSWVITGTVTDHWQLGNVDLLIQKAGARG